MSTETPLLPRHAASFLRHTTLLSQPYYPYFFFFLQKQRLINEATSAEPNSLVVSSNENLTHADDTSSLPSMPYVILSYMDYSEDRNLLTVTVTMRGYLPLNRWTRAGVCDVHCSGCIPRVVSQPHRVSHNVTAAGRMPDALTTTSARHEECEFVQEGSGEWWGMGNMGVE